MWSSHSYKRAVHAFAALLFGFLQCVAPAQTADTFPSPSPEMMRQFLAFGQWSTTADDNINGETLDAEFVKRVSLAYQTNPKSLQAVADLSLVGLGLAIAEWGVAPADTLPKDPVPGRNWKAAPAAGDVKHVMSYAKGGVGVGHLDSGILIRLMSYLQEKHPDDLLANNSEAFFRLKGTNFDKLYANGGHCTNPTTVIAKDLNADDFEHDKHGFAGSGYCKAHANGKTTPKDWQVFRHGMREALRKEDVQFWILQNWVSNVWWPSYRAVMRDGNGSLQEVMINARIRNSSPVTADCALKSSVGAGSKSARITKQLDSYSSRTCGGNSRHNDRRGYMLRSVVAYDAFAKQ